MGCCARLPWPAWTWFVLLHESQQLNRCLNREFGTSRFSAQVRKAGAVQRNPNGRVATIPHGDMRGPTTSAGHRENLEFPLKQWVSWVSYHHISVAGIAVAGTLLILMWGIETCW